MRLFGHMNFLRPLPYFALLLHSSSIHIGVRLYTETLAIKATTKRNILLRRWTRNVSFSSGGGGGSATTHCRVGDTLESVGPVVGRLGVNFGWLPFSLDLRDGYITEQHRSGW